MRKIFERHNLFIFIILAAIAVIIITIYSMSGSVKGSDVMVGIAVELLGAAIIFIAIERVFRLREFDTADLISTAVNRLERKSDFLKTPEQNPSFDILIKEARDVSLLGNSFVRLLGTYEKHFKKFLKNGGHLRIIYLDPNGPGVEALQQESGRQVRQAILSSMQIANNLIRFSKENNTGCVEIKLLRWPTSMGLHIIDPKERNGYLRATIYPPDPSSTISDRAHFILHPDTDPHWFQVYSYNYEKLWERALHF
jgi:hypothetical protein